MKSGLDYNNTINHEYTQFPGDAPIDLLNDGFNSTEFHTVTTGDFIWDIGKWTTTLHGTRYGKTPNYAEQSGTDPINGVAPGKIDPYYLFNLNLNYQPHRQQRPRPHGQQHRGQGSAEG